MLGDDIRNRSAENYSLHFFLRDLRCCNYAKFEVITLVKIQIVVFCVVTPCSVAVGYQRFGGPCCLELQSFYTENEGSTVFKNVGYLTATLQGITTQKTSM
jgi:hypothetical protein